MWKSRFTTIVLQRPVRGRFNHSGWILKQSTPASSANTIVSSLTVSKSESKDILSSEVLNESNAKESLESQSFGGFNVMRNIKKIASSLLTHFLPRGYPSSVTPGYLHFAGFNAVSAVLSSAGGVLSMQTLLYSLGLSSGTGISSTLPLAATLNWILKDGIGQAGTILFASFINNRFDRQPKQWRFLASMSLEVSNVIEISTAFFPQYFLPIAAIANMGKNISFLAASASRAAIHRSFAKEENLADITAKTGSQNILSSLAGTSLGIAVSTYCGNDLLQTCFFFSLLSSTSLIFTFSALKYTTITALTQDRLDYVVHYYLKNMDNSNSANRKIILSPHDVKMYESMFVLPNLAGLPSLKVNPSLTEFYHELQRDYGSDANKILEAYIKFWQNNHHSNCIIVPTKINVIVYFDQKANLRNVLQGFVWAYYFRQRLHDFAALEKPQLIPSKFVDDNNFSNVQRRIDYLVDNLLEKEMTSANASHSTNNVRWITSAALLESTERRIDLLPLSA